MVESAANTAALVACAMETVAFEGGNYKTLVPFVNVAWCP